MDKKKIAILAVGSFNPPTNGHLRMLEDAKSSLEKAGKKVLEGIMSPVSDGYGKKTLISAAHRLAMTKAAVSDSNWIHVDEWECSNPEWTTTLNVLKHHSKDVKERLGNDVGVMLLVGGDVVETFDMINANGTPVWEQDDVNELISSGLIIQPRPGSNPKQAIEKMELKENENNVHIIQNEMASNDISSTRLRQAVKEHRSIKYTTPDEVIEYIEKNKLYT